MAVRVDAGTALVLREAYHKIQALPRGNHYALYDYVRGVAAKVAPVDTFFVGFLQAPIGFGIRMDMRTASTTIRPATSSGRADRPRGCCGSARPIDSPTTTAPR